MAAFQSARVLGFFTHPPARHSDHREIKKMGTGDYVSECRIEFSVALFSVALFSDGRSLGTEEKGRSAGSSPPSDTCGARPGIVMRKTVRASGVRSIKTWPP